MPLVVTWFVVQRSRMSALHKTGLPRCKTELNRRVSKQRFIEGNESKLLVAGFAAAGSSCSLVNCVPPVSILELYPEHPYIKTRSNVDYGRFIALKTKGKG